MRELTMVVNFRRFCNISVASCDIYAAPNRGSDCDNIHTTIFAMSVVNSPATKTDLNMEQKVFDLKVLQLLRSTFTEYYAFEGVPVVPSQFRWLTEDKGRTPEQVIVSSTHVHHTMHTLCY